MRVTSCVLALVFTAVAASASAHRMTPQALALRRCAWWRTRARGD